VRHQLAAATARLISLVTWNGHGDISPHAAAYSSGAMAGSRGGDFVPRKLKHFYNIKLNFKVY